MKKIFVIFAMACLVSSSVYASTILQFTELTFNNPFHVTTNGTTATITAVNVPVSVIFDPGVCLNVGCNGATNGTYNLNLTATSTNNASLSLGQINEDFAGTISFTSGAINLLTVNFSDIFSGPSGASSNISMGSAQPPDSFSGTSNIIDPNKLGQPRGFALSFSNYTPGLSISGTTIGAATADATGTFNATVIPAAVPEPASLVLFGTGLLGIVGMIRRRK